MEIIDGKQISKDIKEECRVRVEKLKEQGKEPCLAVVLVGNDPASSIYVNNKKKACEFCGIKSLSFELSEEDKFWVGADVSWTEWSRFSMGDHSDSLADLLRFSVGGRWIPNALSSHYFMKVNYSLGGFYEKNYVCVGDHQMYRMGMDVGLSFPMKKSKSKLGVCLEIGTYRTADGSGIQERYRRLMLQVQLHEKWYQRRRLD